MKVVVVGAGISGCLAGLVAAEAGHEVVVLEASDEVGGVLRDHVVDGRRFYRNCQYINPDTGWFEALDALSGVATEPFEHHYGAWNDLFGAPVLREDFAQIVVPSTRAETPGGTLPFASVDDRLRRYPASISGPLRAWAARYGDLGVLDADNALPLQVGRVFLPDDVDGVRGQKAGSALADQLYGLPRQLLDPPVPVQRASLPIGGWDAGLRTIEAALERRGVALRCRSTARPRLDGERLALTVRGEAVPADRVVWCANPNPLVDALGLGPLDSPVTPMLNLLAELEAGLPPQPMYWQIFARGAPLVRAYAYALEGRARATFEAFDDGTPPETLEASVRSIAAELGLRLAPGPMPRLRDRRYVLLTSADLRRLAEVEARAPALGLVTGGWHFYGRNLRLDHILGALRRSGVG